MKVKILYTETHLQKDDFDGVFVFTSKEKDSVAIVDALSKFYAERKKYNAHIGAILIEA